jgi:HAMP domain-containing protein
MFHFHSLKVKIIFIIFSVVIVIVVASLAIETTITTKLYRAQVEKEIFTTVRLNINEVDRYTLAMEQKAADLARTGEIFYKIRKSTPNKNLDSEMKEYLVDDFSLFPEAIGGGIWYEPYKFYPQQKYYGPYAFWEKNKVVFTWDLNTPTYDYFNWDWYTLALPPSWDRTQKREREYYWTPPYLDGAGTSGRMITVDAFMHDKDGVIIGISTADWSIEKMLSFLKNSTATENSETFLVDANSNTVMANTLDPDSTMKSTTSVSWMSLLVSPQKDLIKVIPVQISNTMYNAYYTLTDSGMFYGVLVPSKVIENAVNKLFVIGIIRSILLILILILVLYLMLSTITNSILALTNAVSHVAGGDLSTRMKMTSEDEIGRLGSGFNQMVETISTQRQELEKRTLVLEETVTDKTKELETKLDELERLNKLMVGRELKMIELKKEITDLKQDKTDGTSDSKIEN